ncbi:MAG: HEPN domain-containing protein [Candidatus Aminicenantes bacterium]|nr:HEPN domain-containing protein [Candidatus Aminicenantes bacterium]
MKKKHKWRVGKKENQNKFTFVQYVPSDWVEKKIIRNIWISGYRIFLNRNKLQFIEKILDLDEIRLVFLFGKFSYLDTKDAKIDFLPEGKFRFDQTKIKRAISNEDVYLLIITPFDKNSANWNEAVIKEKVDIYLGLLILFFGRNIAHELIFENVYGISDNQVSASAARCENPLFFPSPDLNEEKFNNIFLVNKFILQKPEDEKNRFLLSLRWFKNANFDSGVDAFLKYWIALEIIAMSNNTDIQSINQILGKIYNLPLVGIQKTFNMGRLYGLRSKIIHNGKIIPIHQNLLKYIEAIYKDVYYFLSGIQPKKFSEEILNDNSFNLLEYMPNL